MMTTLIESVRDRYARSQQKVKGSAMSDLFTEHNDDLNDFVAHDFTFDAESKRTYVMGSGPAVIVMCEMPGITPHVARFARWVKDAGFTVYMPSLFGEDGAAPTVELAGAAMRSLCVRTEFRAFANGEQSPMVGWLRQLAAEAHTRCGGPGVGAIGMCFTGNFALALMLEPSVLAAVMSQPSLPLDEPAGTFIGDDDLTAIRARLDRDELTVLGYRFEGDPYCPAARFDSLTDALGGRFVPKVLADSSAGENGWLNVPHSVVTTCLIDQAGQPTAQARDEILAYFQHRLAAKA
jgi:dienelactone hydrolase